MFFTKFFCEQLVILASSPLISHSYLAVARCSTKTRRFLILCVYCRTACLSPQLAHLLLRSLVQIQQLVSPARPDAPVLPALVAVPAHGAGTCGQLVTSEKKRHASALRRSDRNVQLRRSCFDGINACNGFGEAENLLARHFAQPEDFLGRPRYPCDAPRPADAS